MLFIDHTHVFNLSDHAHYSQIQKFEISIIDEIGAFKVATSDANHANSDKFSIYPVE